VNIVCAIVAASLLQSGVAVAQTGRQFLFVYRADGKVSDVSQIRPTPYEPGMRPSMTLWLGEAHAGRDKDGRVVSGIALYAWKTNGQTTLVVLEMVPASGSPNRYFDNTGDGRNLRLVELARLPLRPGAKTTLTRMQDLDVAPLAVSVEDKLPAETSPQNRH
jgi:hypothetical protein